MQATLFDKGDLTKGQRGWRLAVRNCIVNGSNRAEHFVLGHDSIVTLCGLKKSERRFFGNPRAERIRHMKCGKCRRLASLLEKGTPKPFPNITSEDEIAVALDWCEENDAPQVAEKLLEYAIQPGRYLKAKDQVLHSRVYGVGAVSGVIDLMLIDPDRPDRKMHTTVEDSDALLKDWEIIWMANTICENTNC